MTNWHNEKYTVVMSDKAVKKVLAYKKKLSLGQEKPGTYLKNILGDQDLSKITNEALFQAILQTKKPQIFAESAIQGDGKDWNNEELSILGDVNIAVPVTIYDNMGRDAGIKIHDKPFEGELLYSPGCLLRGDKFAGGSKSLPDYMEVVKYGEIDQEAYNQLVARRLLPVLKYANEQSTQEHKAIINIPGLGCGQFAGEFQGKVGKHLDIAIQKLLETHSESLQNIAMVRFDPFNECRDLSKGLQDKYESIVYRVRPLLDNYGKTQLCPPTVYQENGDDFTQCKLFKVVAWDHVSYPGNDFWKGSRNMDDGIAAAATDSMNAFAKVKGHYDKNINKFVMSNGSCKWGEEAQLLTTINNVMAVRSDGQYVTGSFSAVSDEFLAQDHLTADNIDIDVTAHEPAPNKEKLKVIWVSSNSEQNEKDYLGSIKNLEIKLYGSLSLRNKEEYVNKINQIKQECKKGNVDAIITNGIMSSHIFNETKEFHHNLKGGFTVFCGDPTLSQKWANEVKEGNPNCPKILVITSRDTLKKHLQDVVDAHIQQLGKMHDVAEHFDVYHSQASTEHSDVHHLDTVDVTGDHVHH